MKIHLWVCYEWVNKEDIKMLGLFVFKRSAVKAARKNRKRETGIMRIPLNTLSKSNEITKVYNEYPNL